MYAWEIFFQKQIHEARMGEIKHEKKMSLSGSVFFTIFITGHGVILFFTFAVFVWAGNEMEAETAFAVIAVVYTMNMAGVGFFAFSVNLGTILSAGAKRISNALTHPFADKDYAKTDGNAYVLKLEDFSASWTQESETEQKAAESDPKISDNLRRSRTSVDMTYDTLVNISMTLNPKSLTAVVGSVGSGKSSLLFGIMGELLVKSGSITLNGRMAYVE
jgi:ABC-type transport system involved in cytochrome bd biosynthesis fused ATPase/permease subunit